MTTRTHWLYLIAISMVLALTPSRAHAQSACVDSNTPAGIALADLNEHLDRIGSRLDVLDTLFSSPIGLINLLVAQTTGATPDGCQ
ncbi:hypothetical protein SAMN05443572_10773 [Myxococcus fulvus]|uniref:Lipoprotein n=1 Tax=Myxococcus fulvus TaxID=33 RepID=A0A511T967_MYXFU|nr:hypothetical protein [Myxococcus fulvus]GEN10022.1 hypothetical protein MFU01_50590 [Myxococcus fulvus]SEU25275.1 hypothetical protein SAMN05443572_10773 [Myxococcus fulvus]